MCGSNRGRCASAISATTPALACDSTRRSVSFAWISATSCGRLEGLRIDGQPQKSRWRFNLGIGRGVLRCPSCLNAETRRRREAFFKIQTEVWKLRKTLSSCCDVGALISTSHRLSNCARSQHATLMFPKSQHLPAPSLRSLQSVSRSLRMLVSIFSRHHAAFGFGHVPCVGHPCQKQPSMKTAPSRTRRRDLLGACTRQRPIHAESQSRRVNGRTNCQFAWRVSAQCDLHPTPGLRTRRLRSRRLVVVRPSRSRRHRPIQNQQRCV